MKPIKQFLAFLSIVLLISCRQDDGKIEFTFLQVNDVYEIAPIQGGKYGGMARLETIHQELIEDNKNTFVMMAGDFLNPSLLGTIKYEGDRIRGRQMVEVMNAMDFELAAFGNHEFDLSKNDLQKRINESSFHWIGANVALNNDGVIAPFYKEENNIKNTISKTHTISIKDSDGTTIKIGFISVCIPSNPRSYVSYSDMFSAAKASYESLKDSVDVVFGLTHVNIHQDKRIAEMLPNIPLIMGGHEHTNMKHQVGNTIIAKADANAKSAYIHKITFNKETNKATVTSTLKEINAAIKSEERVGGIVEKWQKILNTKIKEIVANPNEVIYEAKVPLDGRDTPIRSKQTNLGELVTEAMAFAFDNKVDGALVNGGSIRIDDELIGEVTSTDIFRVLPFGGSVYKIEIKGFLLEEVLNFGKQAKGKGPYLQRFNINEKENNWFINEQKLNPRKTYTLAVSDYLLKGFDIPVLTEKAKGVISVYKPTPSEVGYDIRKAVILYLKTLK
ncbi:bifunctional metallophosphatase/5'-nucleotidase [Flavobacteriaceae bacterium S356]|uniref:Bifunctional metallophosphatase/5'-nucleotidase n=1 Tax=Asprobacillus argus TaxID=3076534 RepID=A0ABU3LEX4_9FLAO|nr:bifunctional metallophosphatase/5'-nucleotidase [Flavobacteriaceae bacterium S356]